MVLLSVNSIVLALVHSLIYGGVPWDMAVFTMLGCLWGGRLGPYVAQEWPRMNLKRFFAWVAVLDGALIIFQVTKVYFIK